ncbi:hypothetical protein C8A03DRAFT_38112 [Achaetomium macrosporum]|uniref:Uncharacterized protein n=1 Tax=Achaetomium macrosporum TaxID=79813 RepID=A0AAN7C3L6_9PEZI|nr:hypothetical protein C8A03DRAFT_38112 [Achaetomium macrosporum]
MTDTLASTDSATVFQGVRTGTDGSYSQAFWTNCTPDTCSGFTRIVDGTNHPYGRDFFVDGNSGPFRFEGCGGSGLTLFQIGQFNCDCGFELWDFNAST